MNGQQVETGLRLADPDGQARGRGLGDALPEPDADPSKIELRPVFGAAVSAT
ncbi:hypothetical protein MKZ91_00935 [Ensifer sp. MJa1]|jgi:hypothetical protein